MHTTVGKGKLTRVFSIALSRFESALMSGVQWGIQGWRINGVASCVRKNIELRHQISPFKPQTGDYRLNTWEKFIDLMLKTATFHNTYKTVRSHLSERERGRETKTWTKSEKD